MTGWSFDNRDTAIDVVVDASTPAEGHNRLILSLGGLVGQRPVVGWIGWKGIDIIQFILCYGLKRNIQYFQ